ncbi:hypothetical protein ABFX02_07G055200 [Erythranthe guttata]
MAATAAAAAVASSFSTSMQSLKYTTTKIWPNNNNNNNDNNNNFLKISCGRINPISSSGVCVKWRVLRIAAAVAQEEAAALTAPAEEESEAAEVGDSESAAAANTKLYFGNLPYLCDSAQLAGIVQEYASPELVEVLYDRNTGKSRGFAFVTMSTIEECNTVIQNLDGREYGGRTLRVNFSDKPKPKEPLYPETEYKLFVGNLSWTVTSEMLTQAFQEYGYVAGARVLYDGETGKSRGYGFVCYDTEAEMETALKALDGVELEGRALRVSLAQGKKQ